MAKKSAFCIRRTIFGRIKLSFTGGPTYPAQEEELREATKAYAFLIGQRESLTGREWCQRIIDCVAPSEQRRKRLQAIEVLMC